MGGGASLLSNEGLQDLTNDEKCQLLEKMRLKYDELSLSVHDRNNTNNDEIIVKELETILDEETKKVKEKRNNINNISSSTMITSSSTSAIITNNSFDQEIDDINKLIARNRSLTDLNNDSPSIKVKKSTSNHNHSIDNEFHNNNNNELNKTSMDLISTLENSINNKEMIANFIKKLKDEKLKKLSSEFRARRLTFDAHEQVESSVSSLPDNVIEDELLSNSLKSPSRLVKRTSIFSSGELGVQQEKEAPFPIDNLGAY